MATQSNNIPTVLQVDAITNEQVKRNFTDEEIVQREIALAELVANKVAAEAKAAARQSALAKLAELGLTEEEIAAL